MNISNSTILVQKSYSHWECNLFNIPLKKNRENRATWKYLLIKPFSIFKEPILEFKGSVQYVQKEHPTLAT